MAKKRLCRGFHILVSIGGLCILVVTPSLVAAPQDASDLDRFDAVFADACGPVNLYLGLRMLGKPADLAQMLDDCHVLAGQGADLAALQRAAERHGVHAVAAKADVNELRRLRPLAILHMKRPEKDHFILLDARADNNWRDLDGTRLKALAKPTSPEKIAAQWSGALLILSPDVTPLRAEARSAPWRCITRATVVGFGTLVIGLALLRIVRRHAARENATGSTTMQ